MYILRILSDARTLFPLRHSRPTYKLQPFFHSSMDKTCGYIIHMPLQPSNRRKYFLTSSLAQQSSKWLAMNSSGRGAPRMQWFPLFPTHPVHLHPAAGCSPVNIEGNRIFFATSYICTYLQLNSMQVHADLCRLSIGPMPSNSSLYPCHVRYRASTYSIANVLHGFQLDVIGIYPRNLASVFPPCKYKSPDSTGRCKKYAVLRPEILYFLQGLRIGEYAGNNCRLKPREHGLAKA